MFGGSWKAMQSARGAAGMVPFGKKHDFCPGKGENSGKLIPFLLGLFGYVLVHGDQKKSPHHITLISAKACGPVAAVSLSQPLETSRNAALKHAKKIGCSDHTRRSSFLAAWRSAPLEVENWRMYNRTSGLQCLLVIYKHRLII